MVTDRAPTRQLKVTLSIASLDYLGELVRQGTHGTSVPDVAKTLIEDGIRQAIERGLLNPRVPVRPV
jgi:hypothetical protein